ncbi:meso-butanediol dehydrogenase/(S,S)-butanediol dehydrogenase/diacetyl reductase [Brevundimonas bullata]|uniref:D-xylose 1-dehydrogenase n=1 Tax=Brevundimonas bullata TaxID=13160 RepID=A0A7W7N4S7_9CAUL|nr:SDR family NAD(P)-dependent oxidoreductase [Brevundimonas bullata]MBB4799925.1 meso-butanediol dehydrogenase/(S,S)-butanediol dehydrogenase/diacetyl reductase [Brevundimonas bullata]MBB6384884.1 meso-butanediol dehydrogenase/(S,S)-butanediol dehydrogenase/diacetyl reductase [Brevundimonas bullata]
MGRFSGQTAVITGSGRRKGLGEAIALKLAGEGAAIVISDIGATRDAATPEAMIGATDEMEAIAADLRALGVAASTCACDVRDPAQVQALANHAVNMHGSLDIWVNNAGIGYIMKPLLEVSPEDWNAVIGVNLTGAFFGLQAAARVMARQGTGGRIINIASQAAKSGFPHAQAYTSSKHGLVGLARSAAIELRPLGITVNNVCPNHVTTGLGAWQNEYFAKVTGADSVDDYLKKMAARIPMQRPGLPEDTANAVAFLCSQEAAYITAESLNVSGGEEPH